MEAVRTVVIPVRVGRSNARRTAGDPASHVPGHKGGALLDDEVRAVIGSEVGRADVWLWPGTFDAVLRASEDLAARA
jgi:hypothetical protein